MSLRSWLPPWVCGSTGRLVASPSLSHARDLARDLESVSQKAMCEVCGCNGVIYRTQISSR